VRLDYLIFDFADEETGAGSFDAMASVLPDRVPALVAEVEAVLRWAHQAFGAPSAAEGDGDWDFALQATTEAGRPCGIAYDPRRGKVFLAPGGDGRITLTLTLGGSRGFCELFREAYPVADD
jgi:hypothetical protein